MTETTIEKVDKKKGRPAANYASKEEVTAIAENVNKMSELLAKLAEKIVSAPEVKKPEDAAVPDMIEVKESVNPHWEKVARETLGDYLDHCEVFFPQNGGTIFTLVIKADKSNAPKDYIERYKQDRRSKEIGNEGLAGVKGWCTLVKQNLIKPR